MVGSIHTAGISRRRQQPGQGLDVLDNTFHELNLWAQEFLFKLFSFNMGSEYCHMGREATGWSHKRREEVGDQPLKTLAGVDTTRKRMETRHRARSKKKTSSCLLKTARE